MALFAMLYVYYSTSKEILILVYCILFCRLIINIINLKTINKNIALLIFISTLVIFYQIMVWQDIVLSIQFYRLYFGFFVFVILFNYDKNINLKFLFLFIVFITFAEKIAIFSNPSLIEVLPNYSDNTYQASRARSFFSGLNGFGGSRSVSGMVLLLFTVYFMITNERRFMYLSILTGAVFMSGAYFVSLIIVITWVNFRILLKTLMKVRLNITNLLVIFILSFAVLSIVLGYEFGPKHSLVGATTKKVSTAYFEFLFEYKSDQVIRYLNDLTLVQFFIGIGNTSNIVSASGDQYGLSFGDFYILDMLSTVGFVGICLIFLGMYGYKYNKNCNLIGLVVALSLLHYSLISFVSGQVILALIVINLQNRDYKLLNSFSLRA